MSLSKKLGLSDSLLNAVRGVMQSDNQVGYTSGDVMGHRYVEEKLSSKEKMKRGLYNAKLDPVGKEDDDVDNDGDTDKSDKYLKNRRQAISKAMKGKKDKDVTINKTDKIEVNPEMSEKKLTPAELKKREEIAKSIERDNPDMPMDKKMAIATSTAKRVAEAVHPDHVTLHPHKTDKTKYTVGQVGKNVKGRLNPGEHVSDSEVDDLHDMGMKVKHERKPYNEAKDFDQKFRDRLKFSMSKSKAVQDYMSKRRADRDARHAKQDPSAVKKNYGPAVIPPGTAYNKARKRMDPSAAANAVSNTFKNRAKRGAKLPESVEEARLEESPMVTFTVPNVTSDMASKLQQLAKQKGVQYSRKGRTVVLKGKRIDITMIRTKMGLAQTNLQMVPVKEDVNLEEAKDMYKSAAGELKDYANKSGGMDKKDFHTAAKHIENIGRSSVLQKGAHLDKLSKHLRDMDTSPREKVLSVLNKHGHDVSNYGGYKMRREGMDKPPFDPDPKKKPVKNSDGTQSSGMSRARQLARQAAQAVAKKKKMDEEKEGGDTVRRADVKMIRVKNSDGSVSMRKQRPEVKVEEK